MSEAEQTQTTDSGPRFRRAFWGLVLLLWTADILWYLCPPSAKTVEALYSLGLYRFMAALMTFLTGHIPFSVGGLLVLSVILGLPLAWGVGWYRIRRVHGKSHWRGAFLGFKWTFILAPFFVFWFILFWAAGYGRIPLDERLGLDDLTVTEDESSRLREELLALMNRELPSIKERDTARAIASISQAMRETIEEWDGRSITLPKRIKTTPKGLLLSNGTTGICSPLTLEPHVDGAWPGPRMVAAAAHELGHVAGLCSEDDATVIAQVAGLRADDPFARYALALDIYMDLARQAGREDYKAAVARLPEAARRDLKEASDASAKYRIDWVRSLRRPVYDAYLKSQGVEEGVRSYARGVKLFVALWRDGDIKIAPSESETSRRKEQ